jgi:hypothetical protein
MRRDNILFPALVTALLLATGAALLAPAGAETTSSNTAPVATIEAPSSTTTWAVGDVINFSGHATDEQDGELSASNLSWDVRVLHCTDFSYARCPPHYIDSYEGMASGQYIAPYHELPTYMKFTLTATDSEGLTATDSVELYPKTVELSFRSEPSGLVLFAGEDDGLVTPFDRTEIVGSVISINAPSPQTLAEVGYAFVSWSDGGAESHEITAGEQPITYTATYQQPDTTAPVAPVIGSPSDGTVISDNTPVFSGTAEVGSTVELFDSSTSLGTTPADGSGGWSFTPTSALNEGAHLITAEATDQAGNQSAASAELLVTVDTSAPTLDINDTDAITPDNRQKGVSRNIEPTATFSDEMDPTSLSTSVKLSQWNAKKEAWQRVPAAVSVNGQTAMLDPYPTDPSRVLAANKKFKVTVTTEATNLAGLQMSSPKRWTFTTGRNI